MFTTIGPGIHVGPAMPGCGAFAASVDLWGDSALVVSHSLGRYAVAAEAADAGRPLRVAIRPDEADAPDVLVDTHNLHRHDPAVLGGGRDTIVVCVGIGLHGRTTTAERISRLVRATPDARVIFPHGVQHSAASKIVRWTWGRDITAANHRPRPNAVHHAPSPV